MSDADHASGADRVPGEPRKATAALRSYLIGIALAAALTGMSFWVAVDKSIFWQPGVAPGLLVLAIAQMGIHLVFFLHLTTGPDNTNNALTVAFGVLIVVLVGAGSLWIMSHLGTDMPASVQMTNLHLQR